MPDLFSSLSTPETLGCPILQGRGNHHHHHHHSPPFPPFLRPRISLQTSATNRDWINRPPSTSWELSNHIPGIFWQAMTAGISSTAFGNCHSVEAIICITIMLMVDSLLNTSILFWLQGSWLWPHQRWATGTSPPPLFLAKLPSSSTSQVLCLCLCLCVVKHYIFHVFPCCIFSYL